MNKSRSLLLGCVALTSSSLLLAKVPQLATSWTGLYNDEQKISLFIKQNGQAITGYSLLNGKATNFKGKIEQTDLNYTITLNEVGQGASIGKFVLNYKGNTAPIDADWSSSSKSVKPKFFSLNAQQCKYAKGQGDFPITSTRLLKDADLQVPLGQLQYMRNEVYARHGYAFQSKEWASIFSQYDWYMPCYTSVESRLTQIEKENIKRIKLVEPYAADVDWGR